jgi:hypothetical protein
MHLKKLFNTAKCTEMYETSKALMEGYGIRYMSD